MAQGFFGKDTGKIVLIAELIEHSGRGATHGVLEVDRIAKADDQRQRIDGDEQPAVAPDKSEVFFDERQS